MIPRYQNLGASREQYPRGFGFWGGIQRFAVPTLLRKKRGEAFGFLCARGEVLPKMANALGVSVDILLGVTPPKPKKQAAKGRLQHVFEAASKLPRRQQEKVAEFVGAFVKQHVNGDA